jgi:hypothetical protein
VQGEELVNKYRVEVSHNETTQSGKFAGCLVLASETFEVMAVTKPEAIVMAFDLAADMSLDVHRVGEPEFIGEV